MSNLLYLITRGKKNVTTLIRLSILCLYSGFSKNLRVQEKFKKLNGEYKSRDKFRVDLQWVGNGGLHFDCSSLDPIWT